MSVAVALAGLAEQIQDFGPRAYVVTVSAEERPHSVSVLVEWRGDELVVEAGQRTRGNAARHPNVTLLWPPPGAGRYSLIVDGTVTSDGDALAIRPESAVLHRVAGADPGGPTCVPVLGQ